MQMIDVLKRLAELDAKNPNIVKESTRPMDIEECGDDMMSAEPSQSNSPVSVNISANSGEELGDMLSAIMQLAGVHKVGDEHMGVEPPASVLTAEPNMHKDAHGVDDMRAVLDQMNSASGEEETDESAASDETHPHGIPGVDTTPADPHKQLPFDPNEFSQNTNDGDGNDENGHLRLTTQPTATFESLMAEYKKFVTEDLTQQNVAEVSGRSINGKEIDLRSLEIDGVDPRDYPDFSDAYISYALFTDGSELNDQEMDQLNDEHGDLVHDLAYSSLHENGGRDLTNTPRDQFISRMSPGIDMQKVAKVVNSPEFNSDTILKIVDAGDAITHSVGRYIQKEFNELQYDLGRSYEDYPERVAEKLLSMLRDRTKQGVAESKKLRAKK